MRPFFTIVIPDNRAASFNYFRNRLIDANNQLLSITRISKQVSKNLSLTALKVRFGAYRPSFLFILPNLLIVMHAVYCFVIVVCYFVIFYFNVVFENI